MSGLGGDALWVVGFARCSRIPYPKAECSATAGGLCEGLWWVQHRVSNYYPACPGRGRAVNLEHMVGLGRERMPKAFPISGEARGTTITVAASSMSTWNLSFLSVLTVSFMVGLRTGKGEREAERG